MPHYVQMGKVPRKRHIQFRQPNGALYSEQVFGTRGFSGIASILYHAHPPTQVESFQPLMDLRPTPATRQPFRHYHLRTSNLAPQGDAVSGRVPLLTNANVTLSLCCPSLSMPYFFKNADGDELLFVHEGAGKLHSLFGMLSFREGDYLVIPRGTIYHLELEQMPVRLLTIEAMGGPIEIPKRYRNEYGQLLEHAPFCERDIRVPETLEFHEETGHFEVRIKARGMLTAYHYTFHPFDVVGWDGYVYPWAFNIHDFEPITGSLHQPPPTHQTFAGPNFVVCSFVPRMLDTHPEAIPIPYNHSNVDSDEVLYYVNGNFSSRRGIERGSITLHPAGLPHGPQPGAVEASLGMKRTAEMAVMLDTFFPLQLTEAALAMDDPNYPNSWQPRS